MASKISNHKYSLSFGYPLDRKEATVDISVDLSPERKAKIIECEDGQSIEFSNSEHIVTLEMEEGRDKIQIVIHRFLESDPMFTTPPPDLHLYLDEFMDVLERAKKLLLGEK